jgi:hypothetical protein
MQVPGFNTQHHKKRGREGKREIGYRRWGVGKKEEKKRRSGGEEERKEEGEWERAEVGERK